MLCDVVSPVYEILESGRIEGAAIWSSRARGEQMYGLQCLYVLQTIATDLRVSGHGFGVCKCLYVVNSLC